MCQMAATPSRHHRWEERQVPSHSDAYKHLLPLCADVLIIDLHCLERRAHTLEYLDQLPNRGNTSENVWGRKSVGIGAVDGWAA
jgi:hypothetical protein